MQEIYMSYILFSGTCPDCGITRAFGRDGNGDESDPSKCVSCKYGNNCCSTLRPLSIEFLLAGGEDREE